MKMRSSVGVVMTKELERIIKGKANKEVLELLNMAEQHYEKENQVLYVFDSIKWHVDQSEHDSTQLLQLLLEENTEEFYVVEADTNDGYREGTWGELYDNAFNLGVLFTLDFNI